MIDTALTKQPNSASHGSQNTLATTTFPASQRSDPLDTSAVITALRGAIEASGIRPSMLRPTTAMRQIDPSVLDARAAFAARGALTTAMKLGIVPPYNAAAQAA